MEKEISFKVEGSFSMYPGRGKLNDEINKSGNAVVKLVKESGKIVVYYDDERAGHLVKIDEPTRTPYAEVETLLSTGERIATVNRKVATSFLGSFLVKESEVSSFTNIQTLKSVAEKLVKEGILSQQEIDKRIEYARKYGVTEKQLISIFSTVVKYPDEISKRIPDPKFLYVDSSGILKRSVGYILSKRNLMFEGDRGVGKNVLAETLAWLFARPLFEASMNSGHDNNSLLGSKTFDDITEESRDESISFFKSISNTFKSGIKNIFKTDSDDEALETVSIIKRIASYFSGNKKLKFEPDVIVQAAEYGGVLVLDEFNTIVGHIMSLFNSLLDDRRRIQVPGYKLVEAHPNFFAIATQNRDYQATFENNEATEDRFVQIVFPTLDSIKDILMTKIQGLNYETLSMCDKLFQSIKDSVKNGEFPERTMTIRGFIDACSATLNDIPLKDALVDCVANKAQEKVYRQAIIALIDAIF